MGYLNSLESYGTAIIRYNTVISVTKNPYSYQVIQVDGFVTVCLNLKMRNDSLCLDPTNTGKHSTLTLPRSTSTNASHCKSSGNSPKPAHCPARAALQYASCFSLIWRALSYLKKKDGRQLKIDTDQPAYACRRAQLVSMRVSP